MNLSKDELKEFLDEKVSHYNCPEFIVDDPVSVPHLFTLKEDIEIAGFLTAIISWGNRSSIIHNATRLMQILDHSPYQFITESGEEEFNRCQYFVHRTFNGSDCCYFLKAIKNIYLLHGGLESVFNEQIIKRRSIKDAIIHFREVFLELPHHFRTRKHLADPAKNASAKRINMFLRWMVRKDKCGVDFGIWNTIHPSMLFCPLDVHTGNVSRKLGLISRKANDWKSVEELTKNLRSFDPDDPVKYDFALFGLGVHEKF
jgi:uncharacterized protein (TIGR02757 family)